MTTAPLPLLQLQYLNYAVAVLALALGSLAMVCDSDNWYSGWHLSEPLCKPLSYLVNYPASRTVSCLNLRGAIVEEKIVTVPNPHLH